jgi:hypothetical protein
MKTAIGIAVFFILYGLIGRADYEDARKIEAETRRVGAIVMTKGETK